MRTATVARDARRRAGRLVLIAGIASLLLTLLGGLWLIPDGPTYWRCVVRHAWRRATFRDTRFPWQQRVGQSVSRWQQEVLPELGETEQRVAALQAAAYVLSKPDLAAQGADPVFTLLGNGWQHGESARRIAGRQSEWLAWLDEARRLAPDDPVVIWQATARSRHAAQLYARGVDRPLIEQGARADVENAFWHYVLATMPEDGGLFSRSAPRPQGARTTTAVASDPFAVRQGELQDVFKAVGLDWTLAASPLVPRGLRDPEQFAAAADRAMRSAEYRHPQADAKRRIERAAHWLGLPAWSRARLRAWLSEEFPAGREFSILYSHRTYQPTCLCAYAEVSLLRDALAAKDRSAAQASYRRLLGLFRHLWEAYPSDEQREATRFELLQPCLALLLEPLVQQTGCFPAEFAEQVRRELREPAEWRGGSAAATRVAAVFATGAFGAAGPPGPAPATRGWLILCDSIARAGLAQATVAGLLWAVSRWMGRRRRRRAGAALVWSPRALGASWLAPCVLLCLFVGLEAGLALLGNFAATLTPSQGTEQFLFIAWALAWSTAAAILVTFRRHGESAVPRNVGVLAFVAVLLGCYYATQLFGVHLPNGIVMIPWSNVAHAVLDPTRGRSYYAFLEGREIALVLAPVALAATFVAVSALWQAWRMRRRRAADAGGEQTAARDGLVPTRRETTPSAPRWGRPGRIAGAASLALWSSIGLVIGLGVWVELPAMGKEEETLRRLRDFTGAAPQRRADAVALVARAPVDVALRLRSAGGFWQYLAGSLVMAVVLFAVVTPPEPGGPRRSWAARLSLWPPERCAALRRCLTATLGWLVGFGLTLHIVGFVGAGCWIYTFV